jgi:DNA-binding MarR family transcriptional regulator
LAHAYPPKALHNVAMMPAAASEAEDQDAVIASDVRNQRGGEPQCQRDQCQRRHTLLPPVCSISFAQPLGATRLKIYIIYILFKALAWFFFERPDLSSAARPMLTGLVSTHRPAFRKIAMRLTTYTDYPLRVLIRLAVRPRDLTTIAEIADSYGISENHLTKVIHQLGVAGYIERWEEFRKRYKAQLARQPEALAELRAFAHKRPITLLFAAHDELHNNAVVIHELLRAKPRAAKAPVKTTSKTRRKT